MANKTVRTIIRFVIILLGVDFLIIKIFDYFQVRSVGLSPQLIIIIMIDLPILGIIIGKMWGFLRGKPIDETTEQQMPSFVDYAKGFLRRKDSPILENFPDDPNILDASSQSIDIQPKSLGELAKRKAPFVRWGYIVVGLVVMGVGLFVLWGTFSALHNTTSVKTWQWALVVLVVLVGLLFAVVGGGLIWDVFQQIKYQTVFNRGVVDTQAAVTKLWHEKDTKRDDVIFYIKLSFKPLHAGFDTSQKEVVAEIDSELYEKYQNTSHVSIKYAKDDPLILVIEGET